MVGVNPRPPGLDLCPTLPARKFKKAEAQQLTRKNMLKHLTNKETAKFAVIIALASTSLIAQTTTPTGPDCSEVPNNADLKKALVNAQAQKNGGLGFHMWATVVNRDGYVCAVAFSGTNRGDQWPGSRVISAQKANTANAFSLPNFALSTANLFAATQDQGTLFGLQLSNPVDTTVAYAGPNDKYGQADDPMVGKQIGGVNVFGGGLALYRQSAKKVVGGLGVSGDTSCTDHIIAWKVRDLLNLDNVPGGVAPGVSTGLTVPGVTIPGNDNMINDIFVDRGTGQKVSSERVWPSDL